MNYQNKGKNEKSTQMRTIYITLALALAVMVVLIVLSGAFRRSNSGMADTGTTEAAVLFPDKQVMASQNEYEETTSTVQETTEEAIITTESAVTEIITTAEPVAAEPVIPNFVAPVGGYIMKEHSGDVPVFSFTMNDYRPHIGVDISASIGDDVFASAAGVISEIWEDPMSGNCVSITHDGGAVTVYRNLAPTLSDNIVVGAEVSAGEVIGSVGDSSLLELADDTHLHFELTIDGVAADPAEYISFPTMDTGFEG